MKAFAIRTESEYITIHGTPMFVSMFVSFLSIILVLVLLLIGWSNTVSGAKR